MRGDGRIRYTELDVTRPSIAARSTLYALPPIGVGTLAVEALSSYVGRLAAAHRVSCGALIRQVIAPRIARGRSRPTSVPRALNGDGSHAVAWAAAVGELVGLAEIDRLTLAGASSLLCFGRVVSERRRWCPACLSDFFEMGSPVYEPLVWSVARVEGCAWHACRLECQCPRCGGRGPWLLARSNAGYCPHCDQWLGARSTGEQRGPTGGSAAPR